jgi:hypothetical protein
MSSCQGLPGIGSLCAAKPDTFLRKPASELFNSRLIGTTRRKKDVGRHLEGKKEEALSASGCGALLPT